MIAAAQKENGPAEAATSPSHGSNNPDKENAVNDAANSTIAAAEAMKCPVVDLAISLCTAKARAEHLDERHTEISRQKRHFPANYYESSGRDSYDRELALRNLIGCTEAKSLEGAVIQIAEAIARIDAIAGAVPAGSGGEVEEDHRATDRLLFSALRIVERHCRSNIIAVVGESLISRNCDPWTPVEDRIAAIEAAR